MTIAKRDTHKIKTNPKYKCVDDGSEDENEAKNNTMNDDPQAMSSKELQFRDNLLKNESNSSIDNLNFYCKLQKEKSVKKESKKKRN